MGDWRWSRSHGSPSRGMPTEVDPLPKREAMQVTRGWKQRTWPYQELLALPGSHHKESSFFPAWDGSWISRIALGTLGSLTIGRKGCRWSHRQNIERFSQHLHAAPKEPCAFPRPCSQMSSSLECAELSPCPELLGPGWGHSWGFQLWEQSSLEHQSGSPTKQAHFRFLLASFQLTSPWKSKQWGNVQTPSAGKWIHSPRGRGHGKHVNFSTTTMEWRIGSMVEFTAADPIGPIYSYHPHIQNTLTCVMEIH